MSILEPQMSPKRASGPRKPIKPTSQRTDAQRSLALEENEAERDAALERMAEQRRTRLSAGDLLRLKNRP